MMRYLLMMLMVIVATQVTASGVYDVIESLAERAEEVSNMSEVEVVELFHAETPEELEAALTDGYPMPWLEDILSDETIPEEDRYWLDCRVRAAIAQDLHLFYDRDDNPVYVEADYIGPGEDYWREHMMVNPLGNNDVPDEDRPTRALADPGYILDLFGNRVGQLAEVRGFVSLSRDASIAAVVSGGRTLEYLREPFACFMYPDGSFKEFQVETSGDYEAIVSSNGEIVVFQCDTPDGMYDIRTHERTDVVAETFIYDPYGNLIHSVSPAVLFGSGERVKISSTGRFICDMLSTGELFLIDCETDYSVRLISESEGGRGRTSFNYSPDGDYLCTGGFSTGIVIYLDASETIWESSNKFVGINDNVRIHCSNGAKCIASTTRHGDNPDYYYELEVYLDNDLVHNDTAEGRYNEETVVSPNGYFLLTCKDDVGISSTSLPTVIRQIKREGSE
jgi:hypothetical protein